MLLVFGFRCGRLCELHPNCDRHQHARSQPPTEFDRLVAAAWVTPEERSAIGELLERKALAGEKDREAIPGSLRAWMAAQLAHYEAIGPALAVKADPDLAPLDALLAETVDVGA